MQEIPCKKQKFNCAHDFRRGGIALKRLICLLLCLLLPLGAAADVLPSKYKATLSRDTRMRVTPDDTGRSLPLVKEGEQVLVHTWAEDWCLCSYDGAVGYLPTERLFEYIALHGERLPLWQELRGVGRITAATHAAVDGYSGNDFAPGDLIALIDDSGAMTMHRDVTALPAGTFEFIPFSANPDAAEPGDLLYACTTYYNDETGGKLAQGRQYNIELAVARIHGTVLSPGEVFSYNALCAPYNAANGYVKAPKHLRQRRGRGRRRVPAVHNALRRCAGAEPGYRRVPRAPRLRRGVRAAELRLRRRLLPRFHLYQFP